MNVHAINKMTGIRCFWRDGRGENFPSAWMENVLKLSFGIFWRVRNSIELLTGFIERYDLN